MKSVPLLVGLGDGIPKKWLKRLSADNGGRSVHEAPREMKLQE